MGLCRVGDVCRFLISILGLLDFLLLHSSLVPVKSSDAFFSRHFHSSQFFMGSARNISSKIPNDQTNLVCRILAVLIKIIKCAIFTL